MHTYVQRKYVLKKYIAVFFFLKKGHDLKENKRLEGGKRKDK